MTVDPFDPDCAVCEGDVEIVHVESRVNTVVRHYRCRGQCQDLGGHIVTSPDDKIRHIAGPVFKGKNPNLVAGLQSQRSPGRAD